MSLLKAIYDETLGLFVDDGMLALQLLVLALAALILVKGFGLPALAGAGLVLIGCLVILGLSLARKAGQ